MNTMKHLLPDHGVNLAALQKPAWWLFVLGVLVLVGGGMWWVQQPARAPEMTYPLINGRTLGASDLNGKVVMVQFWATTCTTCVAEMPKLMERYQRYHDRGFELVAVALSYDPPEQVRTFTQQWKLPFPVASDGEGRIAQAFGGVQLTPTGVLIDRRGHQIQRTLGEPDYDRFDRLLEQLLAG